MMKSDVLLGVTGSIAAYKSAYLARLLVTDGFSVRVAMTKSAQEFVGPLTFEAITGAPVYDDPLTIPRDPALADRSGIAHTDLTMNALAFVIAPATANCVAKLAAGLADDAVSVLALAMPASAPLVIAPAMNPRMWRNAAVEANIAVLRERGAVVIDPGMGDTACRDLGQGRMREPEEILARLKRAIAAGRDGFRCRRILVLTGPTREHLDDVRFISNGSSGKMGVALASAAFEAGHDVEVISGPAAVTPPSWIPTTTVESADDLLMEAKNRSYDFLFSPAAVADYRPDERSRGKPAKRGVLTLKLAGTPDVLASLAKSRPDNAVIIAFAAEESLDEIEKAISKAREKGADRVVVNAAKDSMNSDTATVLLCDLANGSRKSLGPDSKSIIARRIVDQIAPTCSLSGSGS